MLDPLIILGMHRSGTSALTRVLNLCGFELGSDLMQPMPDNPTGFWEHQAIVDLNDELLGALGLCWQSADGLPEDWVANKEVEKVISKIGAQLRADFGDGAPWALKDPRICRLLPLWRVVFARMGVTPRFVLVVRDPEEVARSLAYRNDMPVEHGYKLWLRYVCDAELETRGSERVVVSYGSLLEDWQAEMARLSGTLGLELPNLERNANRIDQFLKPALRHHTADPMSPSCVGPVPRMARIVFRAMMKRQPYGRLLNLVEGAADVLTAAPEGSQAAPGEDLYGRAEGCIARGDVEGAMPLLEALVAQDPVHAFSRNDLGVLLAERGDIAQAAELLLRAHDIAPNEFLFLNNLSHVLLALSRKDEAEWALRRFASRYPDHEDARKLLHVVKGIGRNAIGQAAVGDSAGTDRASVIIPIFNQPEYVEGCLEALFANTPPGSIEVILVDNASDEPTRQVLERAAERHADLRLIRNAENRLFAAACNQGAAAARTGVLVFLNSDTEVQSGWLEAGMERLASSDHVGIVGARLLYPDGTIQHGGISFLESEQGGYDIWPEHRFRYRDADDPAANRARTVAAVTGACMFVRSDVFKQLGGFDEDYGMYFEDSDLCMQAHAQGLEVWYEPKICIVHAEGASTGDVREIDRLTQAASQRFFERWGDLARTLVEPEDWVTEPPRDLVAYGERVLSRGAEALAWCSFERALELNPRHPTAHNDLAVLYWQRGDTARALRHLASGLQSAPRDPDLMRNLIAVLDAAGEEHLAREIQVQLSNMGVFSHAEGV